jgi:hypothetical protein
LSEVIIMSPLYKELITVKSDATYMEGILAIVPSATHLFEKAGALDDVTELAAAWFKVHF